MKNSIKIAIGVALFFVVVWACSPKSGGTMAQSQLPPNVLASCTVSQDTFNHWFGNDTATNGGFVKPANSVTFQHQNNCQFYQWSEQMFLWLTSPSKDKSSTVLEGPLFYNVSPDSANQRTLTAHTSGPMRMFSHIQQEGPNRLPVVFSKDGRMLEVEEAKPVSKTPSLNAMAMVNTAAGGPVAVANVKLDAKGTAVFLDARGNQILHPKANIHHTFNKKNIVERFVVGKQSVFLDADGNQVQTEAGQATGDVFMAKNGGLVYYLSLVNDVYAWFLTGANNKALTANEFPTTAGARDSICAYARKNGVKMLPDSNALAMEIKTSWVEASKLKDPENYVTVMATIPTYDTTNAAEWVPKKDTVVKMAMMGMHIVGSVAGHPEMIWATFEHQDITPNATYTYVDVNNKVDTVKQDAGSDWIFSSNAADPNPNIAHMINRDSITFASFGDTIKPTVNHKISPSNTLMIFPWGSAMGSPTNAEDKSSAASNSEIISINNVIRGFLVGNDVRKNYLLIGATWTSGGVAPSGVSYGYKGDTTAGVSIGTSVLANSTMETYIQRDSTSCLYCHSGGGLTPSDLSHIFADLQSLPTDTASANKKKKK